MRIFLFRFIQISTTFLDIISVYKRKVSSLYFSFKYLVIWAYILDKCRNCQAVSIMSVIKRPYFNDCHWQGMFLPFLHVSRPGVTVTNPNGVCSRQKQYKFYISKLLWSSSNGLYFYAFYLWSPRKMKTSSVYYGIFRTDSEINEEYEKMGLLIITFIVSY